MNAQVFKDSRINAQVSKDRKSAGTDLVNNRLLKELAYPLSLPLCDLYNFSSSLGTVPNFGRRQM